MKVNCLNHLSTIKGLPALNAMNRLKIDRIGTSRHILRIEIPPEGDYY